MITYLLIIYFSLIITLNQFLQENEIYYIYTFITSFILSFILNKIFGNPILRFENYLKSKSELGHSHATLIIVFPELIILALFVIASFILF